MIFSTADELIANPIPWILSMVLALVVAIPVAVAAYRIHLKNVFEKTYGVRLDRSFWLRRSRGSHSEVFTLVFPRWLYANKDGSRNKVRSNNNLIRDPSVLSDGDLMVMNRDPLRLYSLVVTLRDEGFDIPYNRDERKALVAGKVVERRRAGNARASTASDFFESFEGDHRDFEFWCAELLRMQGWDAEVTQGSNDGGVDIVISRGNQRAVVECKLYTSSNTVGRPLLQKLVGARAAYGTDLAFFMTTSSFTRYARDYSSGHNIVLFEGPDLIRSFKEAQQDSVSDSNDISAVFSLDQILAGYPSDAHPRSIPMIERQIKKAAFTRNASTLLVKRRYRRRRRSRFPF